MPQPSIIASDGSGVVGKSTVGKIVARKLGYRFMNTSEVYCVLTWLVRCGDIDLEDEAALSKLANEVKIEVAPLVEEGYNPVFVNNFNANDAIHSPEVEAGGSQVAKVAGLRRGLVGQ